MSNIQEQKPRKSNAGRKWFDGKDENVVVPKLESVFAIEGTVEEACFYGEISKTAFYNYLDKHPKFRERIEELRQKPVLKARQTAVRDLETPDGARWYLAKKRRGEFGDNMKVDVEITKKIISVDE